MTQEEMVAAKVRDRRAARAAAYKYLPTNPFPDGSRLHRYYIKACRHRDNMDALVRDLESVYGPIVTPREGSA
jgi:hypothetical protein